MKRPEALLLGALEALHHGIMHASTLVDIRSKLTSKVKAAQLQVGEGKSSPISFFSEQKRVRLRAAEERKPVAYCKCKGIDRPDLNARTAGGRRLLCSSDGDDGDRR
jgi:hypothetical protein